MSYYYTDPSKGIDDVVGPVTLEEIRKAYTDGEISQNASVNESGMDTWEPLLAVLNPSRVSVESSGRRNEVVVTDIKMPFSSMVEFMILWALASIPAFLILLIIGFAVMSVFAIIIGALFG